MTSKKVKQSQLDSLCDYLSDTAICFLDPQGRVSDWNTGAERFFGMPEATVMGKLPHMLFEHAPLDESLQEAYRNGHYSGDWRLLHAQENARTVFVTIRSVLEEGQLVGFSLLCHNTLYEEKIAGPSVKALPTVQSQHLFEQLVSHSYSGISLFNAEFKMIYRSPSAARITGFSDIDRFEASINHMIHPADRATIPNSTQREAYLKNAAAALYNTKADPAIPTTQYTICNQCVLFFVMGASFVLLVFCVRGLLKTLSSMFEE